MNDVVVNVKLDHTEVDSALEKAGRLNAILEEAKSIFTDLANLEIKFSVDVACHNSFLIDPEVLSRTICDKDPKAQ